MAIVGASSDPKRQSNSVFQQALMNSGYSGKIYPISRSEDEILNLKAYRSIMDVPGPVDYVIAAIPATAIPELMRECVDKNVKVVNLFTAGFSETESEAGRELEKTALKIASEGNVRLLGPNCMGVYCPESGLSFSREFSKVSGSVGYLCQSGGNANYVIESGLARGIHFSKVISYGNALDLNEADLLECLAEDPQTRTIAAYIEGFRDGRRFFELLQQVALNKPVIAVKGGRTAGGARAVSSHTGSLAGSDVIWETLSRQTGMITAADLDEMIDLLVTFEFFRAPVGPNAAIFALGGGVNVLATDTCESAGIKVPRFPNPVVNQLREIFTAAGVSVNNPIDAALTRHATTRAIQLLSGTSEIDFLLVNLDPRVMSPLREFPFFETQIDFLIQASKNSAKPMAVVINDDPRPQWADFRRKLQQTCIEAGLPVYPSVPRAAKAIAKFLRYHQHQAMNINLK
ncbi:MAG: CoA-binding protein [Dehalococcoidia bacterium]|nr:CoA-binding protein [Dehalococcoidia bacterium]